MKLNREVTSRYFKLLGKESREVILNKISLAKDKFERLKDEPK